MKPAAPLPEPPPKPEQVVPPQEKLQPQVAALNA